MPAAGHPHNATPAARGHEARAYRSSDGSGPKVAFYISHDDEQKVMREAGLVG